MTLGLEEYANYDAIGLRELIAGGEVTTDEVQTVARRALDAANARVNGLAAPQFEPALEHASDGPLAGVPFLIKDIGPMAQGVAFFCGSRGVPGIRPDHDSHLMKRVRAAGLVTLGLTTMPELGLSLSTEPLRTGRTRNPWNLERGAGGSSGGSAALVAAGAVPIAHGSDGAGSIRIPASCCGLVGLKPSRGRTPSGPDTGEPLLGLTGHFGLTRSIRDTAHYLDAIHGPAPGDKYTAPPPGRPYAAELVADPGRLRVALSTHAWTGAAIDPEVATAASRVARTLEQLGHHVDEASPEVDGEAVIQMLCAAAVASVEPLLTAPRRPPENKLEALTNRIITEAEAMSAFELMAALDAQNRLSRAVGTFFTRHDLLVTPTLAQLPPPHGTLRYNDPAHTPTGWQRTLLDHSPFTAVFNITGQPAISLPLAHSQTGLPIGVQLIARYGREDLLIRTAAQLEQALPWKHRTRAAVKERGSK
jgi:amidase